MDPWKVSAQFAAFMWSLNRKTQAPVNPAEAARFARDNWVAFLPCADEGCGRLLLKMAQRPASRPRRPSRQHPTAAAKFSPRTPARARSRH